MTSEKICLAVLRKMAGHKVELSPPTYVKENNPSITYNDATDINSIEPNILYRSLLSIYDYYNIENAITWLEIGNYFTRIFPFGMMGGVVYLKLTDSGQKVVSRGCFPEEEHKLFYREVDPYAVFIAHQFSEDDEALVEYIKESVLKPVGLKLISGRVEGLEEFRHTILRKIKECRFFLCLLTKRVELPSGEYASSTWLYQETGAALAYGKKPLLLVEDGIASHYVGEFQKVYEHIGFTRSNHPKSFESISRRFLADLEANHIPLPKPAKNAKRS
jgi:hypothetical protein